MSNLIALGDSHLEALKFAADLGLLLSDSNEFCIVPGATAVGLRNPNSITDALNIFRRVVAKKNKSSYILMHLGEVDCGFVIWWRAKKYGESIEKQVNDSLMAYQGFIRELRSIGYEKICIAGASLPTIKDGMDFGDVANKRSEIHISIHERTQLTLAYNAALKDFAAHFSVFYFDISDAILNKMENTVCDFFRSSDPTDHHLDKAKACGVWAIACNNFLRS